MSGTQMITRAGGLTKAQPTASTSTKAMLVVTGLVGPVAGLMLTFMFPPVGIVLSVGAGVGLLVLGCRRPRLLGWLLVPAAVSCAALVGCFLLLIAALANSNWG